jgi:secreted protein with Ig-like and vWFA domain
VAGRECLSDFKFQFHDAMNEELKAKLTAWALDELPPDEKNRVESECQKSPEVNRFATETMDFCHLLGRALETSRDVTLSDEQRAALVQALAESEAAGSKVVPFRISRVVWSLAAAAAAVVVALILSGRLPPGGRHEVAVNPSDRDIITDAGAEKSVELELKRMPDKEEALAEHPAPTSTLALQDQRLGRAPALAGEQKTDAGSNVAAWRFSLDATSPPVSLNLDTSGQRAAGIAGAPSASLMKDDALGLSDQPDNGKLVARNESFKAANGPAAPRPDGGARESLERGDSYSKRWAAFGVDPASSAPTGGGTESLRRKQVPEPSTATLAELDGFAAATDPATSGGAVRGVTASSAESLAAAPQPTPASLTTPAPVTRTSLASSLGAPTANGTVGQEFRRAPAAPAAAGLGGLESLARESGVNRYRIEAEVIPTDELAASKSRNYYFSTPVQAPPETTNESYAEAPENGFQSVTAEPVSTFSIDVDSASYANVRRFLNQGQRPPRAAVRLEEMINYFTYDYPQPDGDSPFSVIVNVAECPWQPAHRLARVGLKGREIAPDKRPLSNLVFLVDVSGSMQDANKLPLVKQSLHLLAERLTENDRVAMVTYAGNSGLALDSTTGDHKPKIMEAIDRLEAGGSTHGSAGIQQAYDVASAHFLKGGVNRVILATDGDFNVGITNRNDLMNLITEKAKSGVFLSVLGYGMGNLKDSTMEMLADKGNGNYAYIDSLGEARKVLAEQMNATLVTIAKDVKIQVEFNPSIVRSYRLLGYENRLLAREDFNDDRKDAGEIGAGHSVTALYEIVPVGAPPEVPALEALKYQPKPVEAPPARKLNEAVAKETMTVKLRFKAPDADQSRLLEVPVVDPGGKIAEGAADFKFAASVAAFGMLLKDSAHKGSANWDTVRQLALDGKGPDPLGYRGEFIQLIDKARGVGTTTTPGRSE